MRFDGTITGMGFADGHRIVVGRWERSPFGSFADLMLAEPSGRRILLAPGERVAGFVASHYTFDEVRVTPIDATLEPDTLEVAAGDVRLAATFGARAAASSILRARPAGLARSDSWSVVESILARALGGILVGGRVEPAGTTRAGARERYVATDLRPVVDAHAEIGGRACGALVPLRPAGFGFSEFPARPSHVVVAAIFADASARPPS